MRMLSNLKQLKYLREFRIAPSVWRPELLSEFEKLIEALRTPPPPPEPAEDREKLKFLADVGTGLWRLRQKMLQPGTDRPMEEMRRAYRHFESVWDALTQAGVQIRDHTGELVPEGGIYALKTIAYQPTPGISREKVIETVRPTIYFLDEMIQMGEVIVGTPVTPAEGAEP